MSFQTIGVGSRNPVKIEAVLKVTAQYLALQPYDVIGVDVQSAVREQPLSLQETVEGAMHRASEAYKGNYLGFGIESGLMNVPYTKSGMMDVCVCAIYNGHEYHHGLSCAFECPTKVMELVHQGLDLNAAFKKTGLTESDKLGNAEGAIGLLTKGRISRRAYTEQAVISALIPFERFNLYKK